MALDDAVASAPRHGGSAPSVRACALLLTATTLFACAPVPQIRPPSTTPAAPAGFPAQRYEQDYATRGRVYRISTEHSVATFKVYRGGRLARLGHNHVIVSRHLHGYAFLADDPADSRADLYLPVQQLLVDEPADRAAAGDGFATELSADAVAGTRANMLGNRGLDAARFPFIEIAARIETVDPPLIPLELEVSLHGVTRQLSVSARLEVDDDNLRLVGQFEIDQSDFGITPFSALRGSLLVQDRVQISYAVSARRVY